MLSLTEALVHNIAPTVLIVGTRSPIHRKIEVRKHLTPRHVPVRRTTFPQALPPAAASWLLCSSHHQHRRNHQHHIFHIPKFEHHPTINAPPRTSAISGKILHQIHALAPYPRPDPHPCPRPVTFSSLRQPYFC
jgi:hypothetical protein